MTRRHEAEVNMALRACLYLLCNKGPYEKVWKDGLIKQIEKLLKERDVKDVDA